MINLMWHWKYKFDEGDWCPSLLVNDLFWAEQAFEQVVEFQVYSIDMLKIKIVVDTLWFEVLKIFVFFHPSYLKTYSLLH